MKNKITSLIVLPVVLAFVALNFCRAQEEINITNVVPVPGLTKPIPVSLEGFTGEAAEVLKFDLYVQGFSFVTPDSAQYRISGSNVGNVQGYVTDTVNAPDKIFAQLQRREFAAAGARVRRRHCSGHHRQKRHRRRPKSRSRRRRRAETGKFTFRILTATTRRP